MAANVEALREGFSQGIAGSEIRDIVLHSPDPALAYEREVAGRVRTFSSIKKIFYNPAFFQAAVLFGVKDPVVGRFIETCDEFCAFFDDGLIATAGQLGKAGDAELLRDLKRANASLVSRAHEWSGECWDTRQCAEIIALIDAIHHCASAFRKPFTR